MGKESFILEKESGAIFQQFIYNLANAKCQWLVLCATSVSWLEAVVWNEAALTLLPSTVQHLSSHNSVLDLEANALQFEP